MDTLVDLVACRWLGSDDVPCEESVIAGSTKTLVSHLIDHRAEDIGATRATEPKSVL
jgi:hypothetical protein